MIQQIKVLLSNKHPVSKKGANTVLYTVKPVLSDYLKTDKTKVLMENGSLMEVESIAECSPWSILQYY